MVGRKNFSLLKFLFCFSNNLCINGPMLSESQCAAPQHWIAAIQHADRSNYADYELLPLCNRPLKTWILWCYTMPVTQCLTTRTSGPRMLCLIQKIVLRLLAVTGPLLKAEQSNCASHMNHEWNPTVCLLRCMLSGMNAINCVYLYVYNCWTTIDLRLLAPYSILIRNILLCPSLLSPANCWPFHSFRMKLDWAFRIRNICVASLLHRVYAVMILSFAFAFVRCEKCFNGQPGRPNIETPNELICHKTFAYVPLTLLFVFWKEHSPYFKMLFLSRRFRLLLVLALKGALP